MAVLERFTTIASSTGISRTARTSTLSIQSFEKERGRRWLDSDIRFSANIHGANPAASNIRPECDRNVRRSILALPPNVTGLYNQAYWGQVHSLPAPTGSRMCGATGFERGRLRCNSQWDRSSERLSKHTAFPTSLVCRDTEIGA